jgi:omega-6 fatty acid desaturase (delta-12 desaturase)
VDISGSGPVWQLALRPACTLRWFTANIGVHHVHHLSSRIPFCRLQRALHDHPELQNMSRLALLQSFRCVRLVLWDEGHRRLVSFREIGRR